VVATEVWWGDGRFRIIVQPQPIQSPLAGLMVSIKAFDWCWQAAFV
jgi:hypothetical protein